MRFSEGVFLTVSLVCAGASGSCASSHSCTGIGAICDQTRITLKAPSNAWAPGMYTLGLSVDGAAVQCTLAIPDSPPGSSIQGICSAANTTFTLEPVCPQPAPVCDNTACMGSVSSANCLPGQFQIQVVVSSPSVTDAQPHVVAQVVLDLSVDGRPLTTNLTIAPRAVTTEPNGSGCGVCTNASALVAIGGG